jgi:hypothetical protein
MAFVCTIRSCFGCDFSLSLGRAPLPPSKDRQTMLILNSFPAGPVARIRGRKGNCNTCLIVGCASFRESYWCSMDVSPIRRFTEFQYRFKSEFPNKWTIPHASVSLLGPRCRNFHVIYSPRTRPHHWHLLPHSESYFHHKVQIVTPCTRSIVVVPLQLKPYTTRIRRWQVCPRMSYTTTLLPWVIQGPNNT